MTPPRVLTLRAMGRRVRVRAERGVPEEFLERLRVSWADCLEPEAVEPAAQPDVVVRLVGADSAPALEASGAGPGEAGSVDSAPAASGGKGSETPGPACLAVGPEPTWPGAEQSFTTMVTTALLGVLVGRAHLLHAAALAPPEAVVAEGRPRALVLVGPSGRGKTTASLALARAGWAYLSDETAVIDPAQRTVIPYPKPLSVIEEAGRPKVQRAVGGMGLTVLDRGAPLGGLVLLRRIAAGEQAEGLQTLIEQSSGLERMPDGVGELARLVEATGGVRRVLYREAATLDPVLRGLTRDPEATVVREPWTRVREEAGAPPSGLRGRWRRAPGTHGIDTEPAALVLRPGHSYVLTRAAADAWLLLAGAGRTLPELRRTLEHRHGPAPDGAVEAILATLAAEGLIRAPQHHADSAAPGVPVPGSRPQPSTEAPSPVEEEPAP